MGIINTILTGNKKTRRHNYKKKKQYYKKQYTGGQRYTQSSAGQRYQQTQTNFANPAPRFPTLKGELVRSLSEKYIADLLFMHRVAYRVQRPLSLESKKVHSDFYLPNYNIYVEFWGLLDSNHHDYWEGFKWKVDQYEKHRVKFIPLSNEDLPKLDTVFGVKLRQTLGTK